MSGHSNFIISYNARAGSSAIVSMLSAQKGIHVPVMEHLDWYRFKESHAREDWPDVVNSVFQTGKFGPADRHPALFSSGSDDYSSIGFKARLFSRPETIAPMLVANRVKLFVLLRRDLAEWVSSFCLNENRPAHPGETGPNPLPQFALSKMDSPDRERFLEQVDKLRLKISYGLAAKTTDRLVKSAENMVDRAVRMAELGVTVIPVCYEDFRDDRIAFIRSFLASLGFPPDWPINDKTGYAKVIRSPARAKLYGLGWKAGLLRIQFRHLRYRRLMNRLQNLAGGRQT